MVATQIRLSNFMFQACKPSCSQMATRLNGLCVWARGPGLVVVPQETWMNISAMVVVSPGFIEWHPFSKWGNLRWPLSSLKIYKGTTRTAWKSWSWVIAVFGGLVFGLSMWELRQMETPKPVLSPVKQPRGFLLPALDFSEPNSRKARLNRSTSTKRSPFKQTWLGRVGLCSETTDTKHS